MWSREATAAVCGVLLAAAGSLWLKTGFPVFAISNAGHDDLLFIRQAYSLGAGKWLGSYDNLTHAKGMVYPLLIAVSFLTALPLKIAEQALYLAACGITAWLIFRTSQRRWLALASFALLSLNPVLWHPQLARVIRDGLYLTESLALVPLTIALAGPSGVNWRAPRARPYGLALLLGLLSGTFWLTREEGIWILPALGTALAVLGLGSVLREQVCRLGALSRRVVMRWSPLGALALAGFVLPVAGVSFLNWTHYGVFRTNDLRAHDFQAAYGALARIQHQSWRPYVVWPKDARESAYTVSPAARELAPTFEGAAGDAWRRAGCEQTGTSPCPEILAGWFVWALRDAVAQAGHYTSAPAARAFYLRLADEVHAACDAGRIPCLPYRATLVPPFRAEYIGQTLARVPELVRIATRIGGGDVGSPPSLGPPAQVSFFRALVGRTSPSQDARLTISGWAASPYGLPRVSITRSAGQALLPDIIEHPKDVEVAQPGKRAVRFSFDVTCPRAECALVVEAPGSGREARILSGVRAGPLLNTPDLTAFIDAIADADLPEPLARRQALQTRIAATIAAGYAAITPYAFALGFAGTLLALWRVRSSRITLPLLALAAASFAAVATRIALLAYLDATSMPAVNALYFSPASPFVLLASLLGLYAGTEALSLWRTPQQRVTAHCSVREPA
jgi:hypothetical protein